jgi:hypothetical protein
MAETKHTRPSHGSLQTVHPAAAAGPAAAWATVYNHAASLVMPVAYSATMSSHFKQGTKPVLLHHMVACPDIQATQNDASTNLMATTPPSSGALTPCLCRWFNGPGRDVMVQRAQQACNSIEIQVTWHIRCARHHDLVT